MKDNEIAIAEEHGHPGEPCKYLGFDIWDCGHVDNLPQDDPGNPERAVHDNEEDWWAEN